MLRNGGKIAAESHRATIETEARREAETKLKESGERIQVLEIEIEKEKDKSSYLPRHLEDSYGKLLKEEAIRVELEIKIQKLQDTLASQACMIDKSINALAEATKTASLTYTNCVEKFKASDEFIMVVEEKAGEYHGIGYSDCLRFVGAGNVVDLKAHSFETFLEKELTHLSESPKTDDDHAATEGALLEVVLGTCGDGEENREEPNEPRVIAEARSSLAAPLKGDTQEVVPAAETCPE